MVYKAPDVSIENLTACNFLGGSQAAGNQIWWNGGYDTGRVSGYGFTGRYLSATSTYFKTEKTAATYGIFSSNWSGGTWDQTYASNFNDSGYYIGACRQVCDQTMNHAHAQFNALGYSGSNSGGRLLIENSEFDHNEDGFDTNSQNGDNPAAAERSLPNRCQAAGQRRLDLLGVHQELRARQQQPQRARRRHRRRRPGRYRHVAVWSAQRHGHQQPLRQQRAPGA